jgi:hypothetical protein
LGSGKKSPTRYKKKAPAAAGTRTGDQPTSTLPGGSLFLAVMMLGPGFSLETNQFADAERKINQAKRDG